MNRCGLNPRTKLSELAEQARAGAEKMITKNGKRYAALIDAGGLDYYHLLKRERIHLLLIEDARKGLEHIKAARVHDADKTIAKLQQRRKAESATAARSAKQRD